MFDNKMRFMFWWTVVVTVLFSIVLKNGVWALGVWSGYMLALMGMEEPVWRRYIRKMFTYHKGNFRPIKKVSE